MPRIKKRNDDRYTITITVNGKRKFFYGSTKAEAESKKEDYLNETSICKNYDNNITLISWFNEWYKIKELSVSKKTLESYNWVANNYILPNLGSMKIVDISPLNVQALISKLDGLSSRTINYAITLLGSMLKEAMRYGYLATNVATLVKKPKKEKSKDMVTLSKEQVKAFLRAISLFETQALFKLAFTSGLRRSELLGLRWQDIDFKKNTLSVNQTVIILGNSYIISKTTKNASSRRTISLDEETSAH